MSKRVARPAGRRRRHYSDLRAYFQANPQESQKKVAALIGVSQPHLNRIVNGERLPRRDLLVKLARYANVPLDSFIRACLKRQGRRVPA